jgi:magnesium chelatase family protein
MLVHADADTEIHVEVPAVKYAELSSKRSGEPSSAVRSRVMRAREVQCERFKGRKGLFKNADMQSKEIREFCQPDKDGEDLLKQAITRLGLSARAYDRILKVARTIADLAGSADIMPEHIAEAIQ